MGRVPGDNGRPTFVGYSALAAKQSHPDHMILSPALFKCLKFARISAPYLRTSDHCLLIFVLEVPNVVAYANWDPTPGLCMWQKVAIVRWPWCGNLLCKELT